MEIIDFVLLSQNKCMKVKICNTMLNIIELSVIFVKNQHQSIVFCLHIKFV